MVILCCHCRAGFHTPVSGRLPGVASPPPAAQNPARRELQPADRAQRPWPGSPWRAPPGLPGVRRAMCPSCPPPGLGVLLGPRPRPRSPQLRLLSGGCWCRALLGTTAKSCHSAPRPSGLASVACTAWPCWTMAVLDHSRAGPWPAWLRDRPLAASPQGSGACCVHLVCFLLFLTPSSSPPQHKGPRSGRSCPPQAAQDNSGTVSCHLSSLRPVSRPSPAGLRS